MSLELASRVARWSQQGARALHGTVRGAVRSMPPHVYHHRPLVLAHRGARTLRAENTLDAFALAMRHGADGVELDVQLSADRHVVVFHDDTLARLGHPALSVQELTLRELQEFNVGALVKDGTPQAHARMPLLEEVLNALGPPALVNVELKGQRLRDDGLEVEAIRTVARCRAEGRVLFSSFNPLRCMRVRHLAPDLPVAMLHEPSAPAHLRDLWWLPAVMPQALHPAQELVNEGYLAHARSLGLPVHVWTVNQPDDMARLAHLGVDVLITDLPDVALRVLGRRTPGSAARVGEA